MPEWPFHELPDTSVARYKERAALTALFNLDYHLAVLRGKAGDDGYDRWLARRDQLPHAGIPDIYAYARTFELDALHGQLLELPEGSRELRHAWGTCAAALAVEHRMALPRETSAWRRLAVQLPGFSPILKRIDQQLPLTPFRAYALAALGSCATSNESESAVWDDFEVSNVRVSFDINRPIEDFVIPYDPRMWDEVAHGNFVIADRIDPAEQQQVIPGSVDDPPPPRLPSKAQERGEAGTSGAFQLYEDAVTAISGSTISDFRNILEVDYQVDLNANVPTITLTYRLNEAITMIIPDDLVTAGGLDVDSGQVKIEWIDASSCRVTASKAVRISKPDSDLRELLNFNLFIAVRQWFYSLVVIGACKGSNA